MLSLLPLAESHWQADSLNSWLELPNSARWGMLQNNLAAQRGRLSICIATLHDHHVAQERTVPAPMHEDSHAQWQWVGTSNGTGGDHSALAVASAHHPWRCLGGSWGPLVVLLGCLGCLLEASWVLLGSSWGLLGVSWWFLGSFGGKNPK